MQISHSHKVKEPTALWSLEQDDFCFGFGVAFFSSPVFYGCSCSTGAGMGGLGERFSLGHKGTTDFHLFCSQFCYHPFQLTSHFMMLMVGVWF